MSFGTAGAAEGSEAEGGERGASFWKDVGGDEEEEDEDGKGKEGFDDFGGDEVAREVSLQSLTV